MNILYIEDDLSLQRAVKRAIERRLPNAAVTAVDSGAQAIKTLAIAEQTFGCFHFNHIVCDYDLSGHLNGGDVLAWCKERSAALIADDNGEMKSPRQVYLERFTFLAGNPLAMTLHDRYIEKPCSIATICTAIQTKGPVHFPAV